MWKSAYDAHRLAVLRERESKGKDTDKDNDKAKDERKGKAGAGSGKKVACDDWAMTSAAADGKEEDDEAGS